MSCRSLVSTHLSILLWGGISLTAALESVRCQNACVSDMETLQMFLGQERGLSRLDLVDCSLALDNLVDSFFLEWSMGCGRTVACGDGIFLHCLVLPQFYLGNFSLFAAVWIFVPRLPVTSICVFMVLVIPTSSYLSLV